MGRDLHLSPPCQVTVFTLILDGCDKVVPFWKQVYILYHLGSHNCDRNMFLMIVVHNTLILVFMLWGIVFENCLHFSSETKAASEEKC